MSVLEEERAIRKLLQYSSKYIHIYYNAKFIFILYTYTHTHPYVRKMSVDLASSYTGVKINKF